MKITHHARQRLSERFPKVKEKVESLINKSILFGEGEKEKFLLNQEYDIVFVVCKVGKSDQLRTVLTKDQHFSQNPKKITKPSLSDIEIKSIVKEFCENWNFSYPKKKDRKKLTKSIIEKGVPSDKIIYFFDCAMKMIYQHKNGLKD